MGAKYYLASDGSDAVLESSTGRWIPSDSNNRDRILYDNWAATNTATRIPLTLRVIAARETARVDSAAEVERRLQGLASFTGVSHLDSQRYREAELADVDGTPTAAEYPLLDAEVGKNGVDIAAVATNVIAANLAARVLDARLESVRWQAHKDIDAAVTNDAAEAVLAAIFWGIARPTALSLSISAPVPNVTYPRTFAISAVPALALAALDPQVIS
jgi:hypothetical protein